MITAKELADNIHNTDAKICDMLGITHEEIAEMKWEMGLAFLDIICPNMPEAQSKLSKQQFFWGWWSMQFYRRSLQWCNYLKRDLLDESLTSFRRYQMQQLRSTPINEQLYQVIYSPARPKSPLTPKGGTKAQNKESR